MDAAPAQRARKRRPPIPRPSERLANISHKVLTDTLRRAEEDGLVIRTVDPKRIETATLYQLTDLSYSLDAALAALASWTSRNWDKVEAARHSWN